MEPDRKILLGPPEGTKLLQWFVREGVRYPWGDNPSPYRVWISEVMLQQTIVTAVIPYFDRWVQRFPTVAALAAAGEAEVLRCWEGLGYYSRARNLRKAAQKIQAEYGGLIPLEPEELKKLPGVGDYTAAAIASLAGRRRTAAIDANGRRIAMRLGCRETWTPGLASRFEQDLVHAMPSENPGDLNAALMQLGQLVCRPKNPQCPVCPLFSCCQAAKEGRGGEIPRKKTLKVTLLETSVMVVYRGDEILLQYRKKGIGQGLWSFPPLPSRGVPGRKIGTLSPRIHAYTRYRETLLPQVFQGEPGDSFPLPEGARWVSMASLEECPMPAVYRRLLEDFILFLNMSEERIKRPVSLE